MQKKISLFYRIFICSLFITGSAVPFQVLAISDAGGPKTCSQINLQCTLPDGGPTVQFVNYSLCNTLAVIDIQKQMGDGITCIQTPVKSKDLSGDCTCPSITTRTMVKADCDALSTYLIKTKKISEQCTWKVPAGYNADSTKKIEWKPLAPSLSINIPTLKPFTTEGMEKPDAEGNVFIPFIGQYAAGVYKYLLLIAGIIAAVRIFAGGFNYITAGGDSQKIEEAKSGIGHAIIGLVLVLGSYLLLYTINPDLVQFKSLKIKVIETVELTGGDTGPDGGTGKLNSGKIDINIPKTLGINCPGGGEDFAAIAKSFQGKVTYVLGGKGAITDNTMHMDCSRFVSYVYNCAGFRLNTWTANLFTNNKAEVISSYTAGNPPAVNGTQLKSGDLVGWKQGANGEKFGHVMMYLNGDQFIHNSSMQNGKDSGKGVKTFQSNSSLTKRFRYVVRKEKIINEVGPVK